MIDISFTTVLYYSIITLVVSFLIYKIKILTNSQKLLVGVLYACLSIFAYLSYQRGESFKQLSENFSLASGTITNYEIVPVVRGSGGNKINYFFNVGGKTYSNGYRDKPFGNIPDDKPDLSVPYLVIFESQNPDNSLILLNYPIRNRDDLASYKRKFRNGIPAGELIK